MVFGVPTKTAINLLRPDCSHKATIKETVLLNAVGGTRYYRPGFVRLGTSNMWVAP